MCVVCLVRNVLYARVCVHVRGCVCVCVCVCVNVRVYGCVHGMHVFVVCTVVVGGVQGVLKATSQTVLPVKR